MEAGTTPPGTGAPDVASGAPGIRAEGVRKEFSSRRGEVVALDEIELEVHPGEFVSILGPSGCGKSTFLYIVGGFVEPSAGTVVVGAEPVRRPSPERGIVFQEFVLFPWKTVLGNVTFGLARKGLGRAERKQLAQRYIEMVHLHGFEHHYPKELSGGMKQRLAIARTLATDPSVLLMDEPFGAVDAQTRVVLQQELMEIWERTKKTVLFVTHSVDEAIFLSDRIYVFSQRPARVKAVLEVNLPRPRSDEEIRASAEYAELHRELWSLLRREQPEELGDDGP
ncbi:MAG: ABC transporter ATP-binding protein [Gaiella sp.]|nr:ABC transporter ATP-binding protein [Gaiella sp.]